MTLTEASVLDTAALQQLIADVGTDTAVRLADLFSAETRARVIELHSALREQRMADLQREAHALKSSAGTFGAAALASLAGELERAGAERQPERAAALDAGLAPLAERSLETLQQWFHEHD